jgi:integrase
MATARMDVTSFVGKLLEEDDVDLLREGVRVLAQALMETEVSGQIGAAPYERSSSRTAYGFRFGQLRHTGATLALEAGANPVLVAFRLGHTSTRMLEQHYAGGLDRADRELARALDAAAQMRHTEGSASAPVTPHSV